MSAIDPDIERLRKEIQGAVRPQEVVSHEYKEFRKQYLPAHLSVYEQFCRTAETLHLKPAKDEEPKLREAIQTCHLNVSPEGTYGLAILAPALLLVLGVALSVMLPVMWGGSPSLFFMLFFIIAALAAYLPLRNLPYTLAEDWRVRASNQMVLCMFYVTTYMRHTSNLENAINFAAEHVGAPLSLDLKKVIWDVQTERYASLQESLDGYLLRWKETNFEFVETMNLVQSSLYETSQDRRLGTLEKAMNLILDETYEKMLHYAQNLKSPMTMLHMLGIILPILGLVILPLAVSFLPEVQWYHLAVLYNIVLPLGVLMLGRSILSHRPSGYGDVDITDINPELKKYRVHTIKIGSSEIVVSPATEAWCIGVVLVFLGLIPLILHAASPTFDIPLGGSFTLQGYMADPNTGDIRGPYGLGSAILSLALTLGVGLALAHYYNVRSRRVIKIRNETKALEQEFAGALFQLGNRLGDGLPAEIAFSKVADTMAGTRSGQFFQTVSINIQKMGMSVEQSVFDDKRGAILEYPSPLIRSSMQVLIESSKKGPHEASLSLITMSNYIKEMHRVEERLKDLMSEIISGMRSQINFLTPAIAGIVVGITSMITTILASLQGEITKLTASGGDAAAGASLGFANILGLGIPTYFFQFIVGLYVIQITWLLAYLVNGIENGVDALNEEFEKGRGLRTGVVLFVVISFIVMLIFNLIAGSVLAGIGT